MEVRIVDQKEKLVVTIECREVTSEVSKLKDYISLYDGMIWASQENDKKQIRLRDILYIEAVDSKTFLYTENEVLKIPQRLYELEDTLADHGFYRCSKSVIVNVNQIQALQPELNRSILATMNGGDRITITRRYVKAFLEIISL